MQRYSSAPQKLAVWLRGVGSCADFSRKSARFFLERANSKLLAIGAVAEILATPLFESAAALALRNVNEIVQNRFPIMPGIDPNNQSVTKSHAASVIGNDPDSLRCFGKLRIFRQWNPVDDEHSDPAGIFDAGENRVRLVTGA